MQFPIRLPRSPGWVTEFQVGLSLIVSFAISWVVTLLSGFKAKEAKGPAALTQTESTLIEIRGLLRSPTA